MTGRHVFKCVVQIVQGLKGMRGNQGIQGRQGDFGLKVFYQIFSEIHNYL